MNCGLMPSGVTNSTAKRKSPGQLAKKIAQRSFAILWREGRREAGSG
jgi:hypothetical protein